MGQHVTAPIDVTNAADVELRASTYSRAVEISEDGGAAGVGLQVTWPDGHVSKFLPAQQPIKLGFSVAQDLGHPNPLLGVPANYNGSGNVATLYCKVRSLGGNTKVRVTEWN